MNRLTLLIIILIIFYVFSENQKSKKKNIEKFFGKKSIFGPKCKCPNGTPIGSDCNLFNPNKCKSCNNGYKLNKNSTACSKSVSNCKCPNGTPIGSDCSIFGPKCKSCNKNYRLSPYKKACNNVFDANDVRYFTNKKSENNVDVKIGQSTSYQSEQGGKRYKNEQIQQYCTAPKKCRETMKLLQPAIIVLYKVFIEYGLKASPKGVITDILISLLLHFIGGMIFAESDKAAEGDDDRISKLALENKIRLFVTNFTNNNDIRPALIKVVGSNGIKKINTYAPLAIRDALSCVLVQSGGSSLKAMLSKIKQNMVKSKGKKSVKNGGNFLMELIHKIVRCFILSLTRYIVMEETNCNCINGCDTACTPERTFLDDLESLDKALADCKGKTVDECAGNVGQVAANSKAVKSFDTIMTKHSTAYRSGKAAINQNIKNRVNRGLFNSGIGGGYKPQPSYSFKQPKFSINWR